MLTKAIRIVAALGLLAALVYFHLIDLGMLRLALQRPGMLIIATALLFAAIPVAGLRWYILLRSQGLTPIPWQATRILIVSAFFNNFLPGASGGDLVRGVYVFRASRHRRARSVLSIFMDRLIGAAAFITLGVMAVADIPAGNFGTAGVGMLVIAIAFVIGAGMLLLFGHRIARWIGRMISGRSHRIVATVDEMSGALEQYSRSGRAVVGAYSVSLVVSTLVVAGLLTVAIGMRLGGLSPVQYVIAAAYGIVVNSVPVTPGGLGVGEGAFASACIALEPAHTGTAYGTIFLIFRCLSVLSTLPGLVLYLVYPPDVSFHVPSE